MKSMRVLGLVLVMMLLMSNFAAAQGISNLPGGGWWSGEQVQNVSENEATIIITAYNKDTSIANVENTQTVPAGAAFTFTPFAGLDGMPDGFQGSAVVSSDQPIKAIVNVTNLKVGTMGVDGGIAAAQYQGFDGGSVDTTLYFPLAKGDYYGASTTYYVQNAGDAAATFTAVFNMNDGNAYIYNSPSIEPNRIAIFSVFDATGYDKGTENGGTVRLGSLKVTSTQPMAGVVMEHKTVNEVATALFGTRGFTAGDFDTTAYAPVIKNAFWGQFTGLQVQNVTEGPIDITVTYQVTQGPNTGHTMTQTATAVPAGKSHTFVQLDAVDGGVGQFTDAGDLAGAKITATGNFVAIVNEQTPTGSVGITYSAMPGKSATQEISIPLFKDLYYGSTSGLQIQNVGSADAQVNAVFACTQENSAKFTATMTPQTIASGGTLLIYTPSGGHASAAYFTTGAFSKDANCSVTITANQNIVAIVNEMGRNDDGSLPSLDNNNYEGFNLSN